MTENKSKIIALSICLSTLSACSTIDAPGGALHDRLKPSENYVNPIACAGDCKTEWQRAQLWVGRHSMWKIYLSTDSLIQTHHPSQSEVSYGFTVTKEPSQAGGTIQMELGCGNALGCDPGPDGVRRAFYYYVSTGVDLLTGIPYLGSIR